MPTKTKSQSNFIKDNKLIIIIAIILVAIAGSFLVYRSFASTAKISIPANWFALQSKFINFRNGATFKDVETSKGPLPVAVFAGSAGSGNQISFDLPTSGLSIGQHKVCVNGRNISGDSWFRVGTNFRDPPANRVGGNYTESSFPRNGSFNNTICTNIYVKSGRLHQIVLRAGEDASYRNTEVSSVTIY